MSCWDISCTGQSTFSNSGIIFERKVMYHVYVFTIGLLANAGLNVVLIPRLGYIAAAYATLFSYVLVAVLVAVVSSRLFRIQWEPGRLCTLLASSDFVMAASAQLPANATAVFLTKAVLLALLATGWYWFVLTEPERRHLGLALRAATAKTLPGV